MIYHNNSFRDILLAIPGEFFTTILEIPQGYDIKLQIEQINIAGILKNPQSEKHIPHLSGPENMSSFIINLLEPVFGNRQSYYRISMQTFTSNRGKDAFFFGVRFYFIQKEHSGS